MSVGETLREKNPTTGDSNTILQYKVTKCELYNLTRDPKNWITKIKILIWDIIKFNFYIDDTEMMTHIQSILPKSYDNILENLKYELYDDLYPLTTERICDNLLVEYLSIYNLNPCPPVILISGWRYSEPGP